MVYIKQLSPPIKISGLSSFSIEFDDSWTFDVSKTYVQTINNAYYSSKYDCWEIPVSSLAQALDTLVIEDSIYLKLAEDKPEEDFTKTNLTVEEINSFKIKPFEHQIVGINYGLAHKKFLLLDEMGGGKSLQIMYLAETLKNRGEIDHCLIICGVNALKLNWEKEIKKFSKESAIVIGKKVTKTGKVNYTTVAERAKQLTNPIDEFFVILNVESLRDNKIITAIKKSKNKFGMIAFDELHRCANKSSSQGENLLKLSADYLVGATGTLLTNNPINLYVPLYWIGVDKATKTNFEGQYIRFGGISHHEPIGYKNLNILKEELESCSIRRRKEEMVDLPPKTVTVETVEMSAEHRKIYDTIISGTKDELNGMFDLVKISKAKLLALTTRLRQATACPEILTSQAVMSSKVERCIEMVEDLVSQGEKVVIMSTFKPPIYKLAEALKEYKPLVCTGDQDDLEVSHNVDLFQTNPDYKVLIGSTAKCATGLTLNAAAYMICIDVSWTSAMNEQCFDRIYRLNNTRPAFITVLQCDNTIDEAVWNVAQRKQELSDYIVDDMDNQIGQKLADEMQNILAAL